MLESAVAITDFLLFVEAGVFAYLLRKKCIGLFFGAVALASLFGGLFHGYAIPVWSVTLLFVGLAAVFAWKVVVNHWWPWAAFVVYGFLVIWTGWFTLAVIFYLAPLLAWLGKEELRPGVIVLLIGSLLQVAHLGFGPAFNHNAVYHVIQMLGLYLVFRKA